MSNSDTKNIRGKLRINSLKLTNFRCFEKLEIGFEDNLTVLVANNGQGKTAILDAIAIALGPFVSAFDDGKDRAFERDDIRIRRIGASNRMEMVSGGVTVEAEGVVLDRPAKWSRSLGGPKARTTRKDATVLLEAGKLLQQLVRDEGDPTPSGMSLPVLAYYPTDRLWNIRRMPYKKLSRTSRMVGYTHSLESGSDFQLMSDWFRYWSVNALNIRTKNASGGIGPRDNEFEWSLEVVRKAINRCLEPSGWGDVDYSMELEEITAQHPIHGELPAAMLSDGIRSMLTLVADIAFRAAKLNPNLGPWAAEKSEGVVLIDEVDMHLHPAWQQTALASLCMAFPNIQFIVTTHSPQVLSSIDSACIRLLQESFDAETEMFHVIAKSNFLQTKGVASSELLTEIMDVSPIPEIDEARMVSQYHVLIQQNLHNSSDGVALRERLIAHFGANHPVIRECDRMIRLQEFKQRLPIPTEHD